MNNYHQQLANIWITECQKQGFFIIPNGETLANVQLDDFLSSLRYELEYSRKKSILSPYDLDHIWFNKKINIIKKENIPLNSTNNSFAILQYNSLKNNYKITSYANIDQNMIYKIKNITNRQQITFFCPNQKLTEIFLQNDFKLNNKLYLMSIDYNKINNALIDNYSAEIQPLESNLLPAYKDFCLRNLPDTQGQLSLLNSPQYHSNILVAIKNQQIVGSLGPNFIFNHYNYPHGKLGLFFVEPSYRGHKYGMKLLTSAINIFQQNKTRYTVFKVTTGNKSAIALYKKFNFQIISDIYHLTSI